ncbi:MAG: LysR family transcriptional regulator, partial [Firmicutes bacterium]|nr:LysR family transcriptional regulator [Bacillota bacterium]
MDIKRLEYFNSVANHLSFTKAAEECHIAQTAMSRVIADMENELGFKLFNRNRHRVELTDAGKVYLEAVVKLISEYSLAEQTAHDVASTGRVRLTIGYGGFDLLTVKRYLPGFISSHPEYLVALREYSYDDIVDALTSNECDIIFTPNSRLSKHIQVRRIATTNDFNKIGVNKDHRLSNRKKVSPQELNGETFICAYDTVHSWHQLKQFDRTCSILGITPGKRIHTNSAHSLLTMVDLGLGIAFLTDNIDLSGTNICLLDIDTPMQVSKLHVAACLSTPTNAGASVFMDYLEPLTKEIYSTP